MTDRPAEILVVEGDEDVGIMLGQCLDASGDCRVTCVDSAADAMREELTARHDVIVVGMSLTDTEGLLLVKEIRVTNRCPVLLLADHPTADEMIEAMRLGVSDVLVKPFDVAEASGIVLKWAERAVTRKHRQRRYRRLRRLSSRIVSERRDIRQRMDLICRDLVYAYRNLAQRVSESGVLTREHLD